MEDIVCFARGHQGAWEAFCPAYDLSVQGVSFDEVRKELHYVIADYVEACRQESPKDCERLLKRSAPLGIRLLWLYRVVRSAIKHKGSGDNSAQFPVACPA